VKFFDESNFGVLLQNKSILNDISTVTLEGVIKICLHTSLFQSTHTSFVFLDKSTLE